MFIVKAMRHASTSDQDGFTMWQCDFFHVLKSSLNGQNAPGQPRYVAPQREVHLCLSNGPLTPYTTVENVLVGMGEGQFDTVYVMNERGKTIETIQAQDID